MFAFSLLLALTLIFLNVTLMTSVHGFGSNNVPPEIAKVRNRSKIAFDRTHEYCKCPTICTFVEKISLSTVLASCKKKVGRPK